MVQLVVKGTRFADEFVYCTPAATAVAALAPALTRIQNIRHRVKLQLFSVNELMEAAGKANAALAPEFQKAYDEISVAVKNPKLEVADDTFDVAWKRLRDLTVELFPNECAHKDGDKAAIDHLYELHENPDIDEDYRQHVYHCRAMLDPDYREHEVLNVDTAALWFCGKQMPGDATIGKYCGNNEKSKITVKISAAGGPAPSKEPRIDYSSQRDLRTYFEARREEFNSLEAPELRERALLRAKRDVQAGPSGPKQGLAAGELNLGGLRPIHNTAQVTTADA